MKLKNILGLIALLSVNAGFAQNIPADTLKTKFGNEIKSETLRQSTNLNPANALFGRLNGLVVMQNTASPNVLDNQASFNIRGISTLGSATPLVIIDGVQRDIENITISEIDKVEVMKSAVASAIYGVQGANGAVLITTKRGKNGFRASADYRVGFDFAFRQPKFVNGSTYAQLYNEALKLDGVTTPRYSDNEIGYFGRNYNSELYPNVDWQDMAYRNYGMTHQANVQFDGGSNRFKYYTSLDFASTSGILGQNDMYSQYNSQLNKVYLNLRANLDAKITDKTTMKLNLLGRIKEQNRPGEGMDNIISRLYNTPASAFPVKTGTGNWGSSSIYKYNPIADIADKGTVKAIRRTLLADLTLRQELDFITDGLYAEAEVAYDNTANYNDSRTRNYACEMVTPVFDAEGNLIAANRVPLGTQSELGWNSTLNTQAMASQLQFKVGYDKAFGSHNVGGILMYDMRDYVPQGRNGTRKNQSVKGIFNYNYANKYGVDAVVNYSGSAVLTEGSQYNVYPAIGLDWTASNEDFLKGNNIITYLKVKSSFGLSGSDLFGHDLDRQTYGVSGGNYWFGSTNTANSGLAEGSLAVTDLKPEKSRKIDAGFDLGLMNKLYVSATYFNERRSNILVDGSPVVSSVIGIGVSKLCTGEVSNNGIELNADYTDKFGDFGFHVNGNFMYAKNKIINNNEGFKTESYLYHKGNSLGQYYGLKTDGFYNSWEEINNASVSQSFGSVRPGDIKYVDQNGDNVVNELDVVRVGYSNIPEIYYGFNLDLSYKNFSLTANFQGVAHRSIYLNTPSVYFPLKNNTNISTWYVEDNVRWTPGTASAATLPRLTTEANPNNYQTNDLWVRSGDYFKLRDIELSYLFDRKMLKKTEMRVFVNGSNLFSLDHLKYADPENYGAAYPTMRSYTLGVELKF